MFYRELFFYRRLIQSKFGHDHASSLLNLTYKDSSVLLDKDFRSVLTVTFYTKTWFKITVAEKPDWTKERE